MSGDGKSFYERPPVVVEAAIAVGADDGYATPSSFINNSSGVLFGNAVGNSVSTSLRFADVNIPSGAKISSAKISYVAFGSLSGTITNIEISCEAADDPAQIADLSDFNARVRTVKTTWNNVPAQVNNQLLDTPDFSDSLQEVIDRAGRQSGQAVQVFLDDNSSSSGATRRMYSFESGAALKPSLQVTYTV